MSDDEKKNTTENPESESLDEMDIWNEGRRELLVTHLDESKEVVTIKKVAVRNMSKLQEKAADDLGQALMFVEQKPGKEKDMSWIESLEDESLLDILDKGWEITGPLFKKWSNMQNRRMASMGVDGAMGKLMKEAMMEYMAEHEARGKERQDSAA